MANRNLTLALQGEDRTTIEDIVIVDSGSNANGEYIRYSDGTQICWATKVHDFSITTLSSYPFPVAFNTAHPVSSTWSADAGLSHSDFKNCFVNSRGQLSNQDWRFAQTITEVATSNITLTAIGRWK